MITSKNMYQTVNVDWNNIKSIKKAEKEQEKLFNNNYRIVETITGFNASKFIFEKIN
jgi:hypothetical protein